MTFFTKYGPAPCDKNCRSEHQTLFPRFGEGLGTRLSPVHGPVHGPQSRFCTDPEFSAHAQHGSTHVSRSVLGGMGKIRGASPLDRLAHPAWPAWPAWPRP